MAIGARVRSLFGPCEPFVTDLYRLAFFDMAAFARKLAKLEKPARVLEVGCGEGALLTQLVRLWPNAHFDGIDLTPRLGRVFQGDRSRVRFQQISVRQFADAEPASVDMVLVCDVMHHIPWAEHPQIFDAIRRVLRPGGTIIIKDWLRDGNPVHWVGYFADRVITGDRIRYGTRDEWVVAFEEAFGEGAIRDEFWTLPWSCNHAFVLKPTIPS